MATGLKGKVVRGFAWNTAERIASTLFHGWVIINVLNRLSPDAAAVVAIMAALVAVFNSFVDSGFSQALIRNKSATPIDYSSTFWFNVGMAAVVYLMLVGLSRPVAAVLDMPGLVDFAPVFFLIVPLGALGIIQQTVLTREFDFRRLSAITFASTIVSGLIAVGLAFAGFGVWALVGQRVAQTLTRSVLLWILGRWRPSARFSGGAIRRMFGYSSRLLATDFLNNLYNSVPQMIIGRIHHGTLGVYDSARKVRDLPVTSAMGAMQSVTFPALAAVSDDDGKFVRAVGRVVSSIVFLMFPMMAGMMVVADEMFGLFLRAEWWAAVPFFRILCLAGFVTPLAVVSSNILRTRSDGRAVVRAEIVKKGIATVILAATIPFGAIPITWGMVGIAFSDAAVSFSVACRHSDYGPGRLARDILPPLALTLVMAAAAWGVGSLLGPADSKPEMAAVLAARIAVGVTVYFGGAALLGLDAFREFTELLRRMVGKLRAPKKAEPH